MRIQITTVTLGYKKTTPYCKANLVYSLGLVVIVGSVSVACSFKAQKSQATNYAVNAISIEIFVTMQVTMVSVK